MNQFTETPMQAARRLAANKICNGYEFIALHEYTDSHGNPSYSKIRLKHPDGRKWIRPMHCNGEQYVLSEPDFPPTGKPLYRLPELLSRRNETVFVVEGEPCADVLMNLGLLATTSGAVDSVEKTNWEPLRHRQIIIWPDNDNAGMRYSKAIIKKLISLEGITPCPSA